MLLSRSKTAICTSIGAYYKQSFGLLESIHRGQSIHTSIVAAVRIKDALPGASTQSAGSQDLLLQNIRSAKDSCDLLHAVNRHHIIMNSKHALQALKTLFALQKSQSSRLSNGEIVNSKDFRKLCELLKSQLRHLDLCDLTDALKCLGYLGVPADSKILSLVMNLISKQVNDLSLHQIIFLDYIMKDFKPTPLVKALRIALPIVFEANLKIKCDYDNVPQITDCLYYVMRRKYMEKSADTLVEVLMKKREELTSKDAKNIVFALCDSRSSKDSYQLLLCHSLDIITDSLDKMDFFEMELILSKITTGRSESEGYLSYYHEEFLNGCAKFVIDKNCSFEHTFWVLKKMNKFNHSHLGLLDHMAAKVEQEPWQLEQAGAAGLIYFLQSFSMADYRPPQWDRIKPLVLKAGQLLMDRAELPWIRLVLDLCILDCWSRDLLNMVFDPQFLNTFMARDHKLDGIQLLVLDQVSATLAPWADRPRAPPDVLRKLAHANGRHVSAFPLQAALSHALGGHQYVLTAVQSPLGHFLDHVVVMRKGGYPVAINHGELALRSAEDQEEWLCTSDIQMPPDSCLIAVIWVPSSLCAVNTERVRGMFRVMADSIEALGICVVPVLQPMWNSLLDSERIPYLMRAINEKTPTGQASDAVSSGPT